MKHFIAIVFCLIMSMGLCAQSRHQKRPAKFLASGDTIKAMTILNKKIEKHSDDADLYLYRGKIKLERKDFGAAMIDFNSFCSLNGTCGEAGYLKSWTLYQQGNYRAAIEQLSSHTRVQPSSNAFLYLGLSHLKLGNHQPALGAFERATQIEPSNYTAVYNAALAAYKTDDAALSTRYFEQATNLLPSDFDAWFGLGMALNASQKFEESNKILRQALAISPNNGSALFNIGLNYFELGDKDQACSYWTKAEISGNLASTPSLERHCREKASTTH